MTKNVPEDLSNARKEVSKENEIHVKSEKVSYLCNRP
jgi:hypothetical protein